MMDELKDQMTALLNAFDDEDFAEKLAKLYKMYFDKFIEAGFSEEQALALATKLQVK